MGKHECKVIACLTSQMRCELTNCYIQWRRQDLVQ